MSEVSNRSWRSFLLSQLILRSLCKVALQATLTNQYRIGCELLFIQRLHENSEKASHILGEDCLQGLQQKISTGLNTESLERKKINGIAATFVLERSKEERQPMCPELRDIKSRYPWNAYLFDVNTAVGGADGPTWVLPSWFVLGPPEHILLLVTSCPHEQTRTPTYCGFFLASGFMK